jgi:ssDNA-binding Zn-finger/Zn-ribbon topoisomerase 1
MRDQDPQDAFLVELLAEMVDAVTRDDQELLGDDTTKDPAPKKDDSPPKGPGPCPVCGGPTRRIVGRKGPFYGCDRYPECIGSRNHDPTMFGPGPCPLCSAPTVQRVGRLGLFYGCTRYPECLGSLDFNPDDVPTLEPPQNKLRRRKKFPPPSPQAAPVPADLVPELRTTVPPLPPELTDEEVPDLDLDDDEWLFDE